MTYVSLESSKIEDSEDGNIDINETIERLVFQPQESQTQSNVLVYAGLQDLQSAILTALTQFDLLENKGWNVPVARLSKSPYLVDEVQVPIELPDLDLNKNRVDSFLNQLQSSGVIVDFPRVPEAKRTFAERLKEFIAVRGHAKTASSINPPNPVTVVNSKRAGDTILVSKGFFLSTQTVFGVSTPAQSFLLPGRYCFGILMNGAPRFQNCLWTIPSSNTIWVQLP